ncbi:MAG: class I SAM-dependent methyltransferase [Pseudomonadota bacterium]
MFEICAADIRDKKVLEIGVGGGRITGPLAAMAGEFFGVDYVPAMVEACRARFPELNIDQCDAQDLSRFADQSFDFILFGFNGIDDLGHDGRLRAMSEIFRVLRPGGVYAFSSQNLDHAKRVRLFNPYMKFGLRYILVNARNLLSFLFAMRHEVHAETYKILSMPAGGLGNLGVYSYCITKDNQLAQLHEIGFENTRALSFDGSELKGSNPDRESPWIYYIVHKPA